MPNVLNKCAMGLRVTALDARKCIEPIVSMGLLTGSNLEFRIQESSPLFETPESVLSRCSPLLHNFHRQDPLHVFPRVVVVLEAAVSLRVGGVLLPEAGAAEGSPGRQGQPPAALLLLRLGTGSKKKRNKKTACCLSSRE